jgi:hypothetical protein
MARNVNEGPEARHGSEDRKEVFPALMAKYLRDPVLPLLALLCMSAFTVATIVLLVVTTANAQLLHGGADTRWASSPSRHWAHTADLRPTDIPSLELELDLRLGRPSR